MRRDVLARNVRASGPREDGPTMPSRMKSPRAPELPSPETVATSPSRAVPRPTRIVARAVHPRPDTLACTTPPGAASPSNAARHDESLASTRAHRASEAIVAEPTSAPAATTPLTRAFTGRRARLNATAPTRA